MQTNAYGRNRVSNASQNWCQKGVKTNLLELLDGTLVDTAALVDQVTGGGRLARVDVADDHDVDVSLLLLTVEQMRG